MYKGLLPQQLAQRVLSAQTAISSVRFSPVYSQRWLRHHTQRGETLHRLTMCSLNDQRSWSRQLIIAASKQPTSTELTISSRAEAS